MLYSYGVLYSFGKYIISETLVFTDITKFIFAFAIPRTVQYVHSCIYNRTKIIMTVRLAWINRAPYGYLYPTSETPLGSAGYRIAFQNGKVG